MKAALRVLRAAVIFLLCAVVLGNVALLFSRFVLKQEPAHILGFYPMLVTTGSMEPALPAGSLVIAHAQADYDLGDVITFRQEGAVVTHRIVEKTAEGYRTAGDANNTPDDETVPAEAVLGRVVLCLPWAGWLLLGLREPLGILLLAAGGMILIFLPEKRGKEPYEDTEKKA